MVYIYIIQFFILAWFIRAVKSALFWIYLWQLKEYQIGRFIDHFRTHKGKKIFFNFPFIAKLILLVLLLGGRQFFFIAAALLLLIYGLETLLFFKNVVQKSLKLPVFTAKTTFLVGSSFFMIVLFLFWNADFYLQYGRWQSFFTYLLMFDVFAAATFSLLVLLVQPFFATMRNRILEKARNKMASLRKTVVVGITGSYGKTSTKEFLKTILSARFSVLATPEHKNSEIGIAETVLGELSDKHDVFIVEMGAYVKGGIKLLCDMVSPSIGVVTGVNAQHLSTFGSMENILSAEGGKELAQSLPKDGLMVFNGDNKYCLDLYKKTSLNKKVYALRRNAIDSDLWTEDVEVNENSLSFIAVSRERELAHITAKVRGKQNVQNLLAAILVAKHFGMSLEEIADACRNIKEQEAGIILTKGVHGIRVIDASYSSNPDGVVADLDYLDVFKRKKVMVMPCLIELGEKSREVHEMIGKKAAEICDMAIITTRERFEDFKKGAADRGGKRTKIIFSEDPTEIFHTITTFCSSGDAVLLEGRVPAALHRMLRN